MEILVRNAVLASGMRLQTSEQSSRRIKPVLLSDSQQSPSHSLCCYPYSSRQLVLIPVITGEEVPLSSIVGGQAAFIRGLEFERQRGVSLGESQP